MIILKSKHRKIFRNSSSKEFTMEGFLEPGLVSYESEGAGVSRLDKQTIDKMIPSFIGCPLVILHTDVKKENVLNGEKDENGDEIKVGEVTKAWWNPDTGKFDCSFVTENPKALKLIMDEGWSGSCAYNVKEPLGAGGELHAMRYDNTILDGIFDHLALVPNPRYEDCTIRMNGKPAVAIAYEKAGRSKRNSAEDEAKQMIGISTWGQITLSKYEKLERIGMSQYVPENIRQEMENFRKHLMKNSDDSQAMFDKERAEHPSFTDDQIWQIVEDHLNEEENMKTNATEKELEEMVKLALNKFGRDSVEYANAEYRLRELKKKGLKENDIVSNNAEKYRPISVIYKEGKYTFIGPLFEDMMEGGKPKSFESYSVAVNFAKEHGYKLNSIVTLKNK